MTVYLGGEAMDIDASLPFVSCYTATQLPMGMHGTPAVTKIVSNMLCAVHTVVSGEALMLAKKSGIDLKSFFHAIRLSAGNSYVFETEVPLVFNQSFDPDFTLALHCKDLGELNRQPCTTYDSVESEAPHATHIARTTVYVHKALGTIFRSALALQLR